MNPVRITKFREQEEKREPEIEEVGLENNHHVAELQRLGSHQTVQSTTGVERKAMSRLGSVCAYTTVAGI